MGRKKGGEPTENDEATIGLVCLDVAAGVESFLLNQ